VTHEGDHTAIPATDCVTAALIDAAVVELIERRSGCINDAGARVSCLLSLAVEADDRLHDAVADARQQRYSWEEIAQRLATSTTTARRRFAAYARLRDGTTNSTA
jgi:AraC-like DNA-binding protein